jgi:hypothetical protein
MLGEVAHFGHVPDRVCTDEDQPSALSQHKVNGHFVFAADSAEVVVEDDDAVFSAKLSEDRRRVRPTHLALVSPLKKV